MILNTIANDFIEKTRNEEQIDVDTRSRFVSVFRYAIKIWFFVIVLLILVLKDVFFYIVEENVLENMVLLYKKQGNLTFEKHI